ncbi:serine/threonine-protein kinase ATR-like isoform X2 [Lingula anatina]|uniref:Serine/threonine-protein kinase ATR n=1 Tax=Lingula anatina TaxID=7574 RepID=A0A1S3K481_LINAN|nr:serine/threonine-protein kinase ATR-like isoform X2 [Lingula anatina]|eukprot:XP_013417435.1 serine/threonine-protein kinase ATR-like isoform X2 [Lingula anatina]
MSGQQDLMASFKEVEQLLSDADMPPEEKTSRGRKCLCHIVDTLLCDMKKISDEVKNTGSSSFCELSLQMVNQLVDTEALSQMFVEDAHGYGDETPVLSQANESVIPENKLVSQAFTFWIVNRLLAVLVSEECAPYHEKTITSVYNILQLLKGRDTYAFAQLASELILCLGDICEAFYHADIAMDDREELKRFKSDELMRGIYQGGDVVTYTHRAVLFSNTEAGELLQVNLTRIVGKVIFEVHQFVGRKEHLLWSILGCQLEFGDVELKRVSLDVCHALTEVGGLPPMETLDYYVSCLGALVELLCSGFDDVPGDYLALETSLANCLDTVFNQPVSPSEINTVNTGQLESMLQRLFQAVTQHGLQQLKTDRLRTSLCDTLVSIFDGLPSDMVHSSLMLKRRREMDSVIISEIGQMDNSQYLVRYMCCAVRLDLPDAKPSLYSALSSSSTTSSDLDILRPSTSTDSDSTDDMVVIGRKRKLGLNRGKGKDSSDNSQNYPTTAISRKSPTWNLMLSKLNQLCKALQSGATETRVVNIMEGLRTVVEVAVWCVVKKGRGDVDDKDNIRLPNVPSTPSRQPVGLTNRDNLSEWLNNSMVETIFEAWKHHFLQCTQSSVLMTSLSKCYRKIVETIASLMFVSDQSGLSLQLMTNLAWMTSLYWIPNDPTWIDLKPVNSKEVAVLASALAEKLDPDVVADALTALCLFPKDICSKWRTHALRLAVNDSSDILRCAAIRNCPFLFHTLGPNTDHLVRDLLHDCIQDKSTAVQKHLAEVVGKLVCVMSRKAVIERPVQDVRAKSFTTLVLKCAACDSLPVFEVIGSPGSRPKLVDPKMFSPFMTLLTSDKIVKQSLIESFDRLFGHIKIHSNNESTVGMLNMCLELIEDPDYHVRLAFSKCIQYLVSADQADIVSEMIVNKLKSAYTVAKNQSDHRLQETVILTIGQLGRVSEGQLLLVVLLILLKCLISEEPLPAAIARGQIQMVAKYKKTKLQALFIQFRLHICKEFLVEALHESMSTLQDTKKPYEILTEVASVFEFPDVKTFIQSVIKKHLLPPLAMKATPVASSLVKIMAQALGYGTRKKLMIENMRYIFCYLICTCEDVEMKRVISFLERETTFELPALLRFQYQEAINELCLHMSTNYNRIFNGLKTIATKKEGHEGRVITTTEQMAEFLQPHFLAVIASFDYHLSNANVPLDEKKMALDSLSSIIRLMGTKHITAVRMKVLNTLRLTTRFKDRGFAEVSYKAWNVYVRSIDLSALGPMLSQIIVSLLPLLYELPAQVSQLFNYLIVENRNALLSHFCELSFLPDIPELVDINAVLKKYTEGSAKNQDVRTQIARALKGVSHECLDVRLLALSKLRQTLHSNQTALHELLLGNETVDPVISQLVAVLLDSCRESDSSARNVVGECLGELGAVDPGRLEFKTNDPKEELAKFHASVNEMNFAFDLINELARTFLAAQDTAQDCCSLAIQDVLQAYEVKDTGEPDQPGVKLWRRFSEHVKEILTPLLKSRYVLNMTNSWSNLPHPIYGSRKGSNFKEWVSTWSTSLVSKVKLPKASKVFRACSAVFKHDTQCALYLLPHIVVQVLLDGDAAQHQEIYEEVLSVLDHVKKPDTRQGSASDFRHMSAQTVFSVLDHLTKWKRHKLQHLAHSSQRAKSEADYARDPEYHSIKLFLDKIPQDTLAEASYNCKAYTRALMHLEQFIKPSEQIMHEHLDFLQKLYVAMDEPDGVAGVTAIRKDPPTLTEQILAHESIGQLREAASCYERAIQLEPDEVSHHQGLMKTLMDLGQLNTALVHADGVLHSKPQWSSSINAYRAEASWKLGSWDKLETFLNVEDKQQSWGVGLGQVLLAAKYKKESEFLDQLRVLRSTQMGPLSAASMEKGSYQRGYEYIVRLHMLNEIEQGARTLLQFPHTATDGTTPITFQKLLPYWDSRLQLAQSSFRVQEPLLTLQRVILRLVNQEQDVNVDRDIGRLWLRSAKVARKAGHLQTAYGTLLNASAFNLPEFCVEKAKWLWHKGDYDQAQSCLEKGVAQFYSDKSKLKQGGSEEARAERLEFAKALLLYARYSEETASMETNAIFKLYKEVTDVYNDWEDGHFYLARYYDKVMTTLADPDKPEKIGQFIGHVIKNFGNSLLYGSQYIYQSMPRMLSLWLDHGTSVMEQEKHFQRLLDRRGGTAANTNPPPALVYCRNNLQNLNKSISFYREKLAPYQLLTAFPQLISRICHGNDGVFSELQEMMAHLVVHFPQQVMWMMMAVSKSSYQVRARRCQSILARAKELNPSLNKFIQDATKLSERLIDLSNKNVGALTLSITQDFRSLKRLLDDKNFSHILLPLQSSMTATLPASPGRHVDHDPFPGQLIYITGFEDVVEVLNSLQKPKKVTIRGSDGAMYTMLCKPKDDLRKDCRLMEFNGIINKCLRKDPESRKRQLHIRTYAVVPLNEECGILEWVPNTHGLRNILLKIYKEKGTYMGGKELKACMVPVSAPIEQKMDVFKNKLLPKHPPVFSEWFLRTFPDPTAWHMARLAYARTTAVISMVGYILGLGDRHGENILFDSTNGDTVHVDFNCLFNKGESFECPEVVPFRLTHNMVDAMGPMGFEGIFRRACEVTLRVMKDQMDPLMCVLKTFIYDPLVEWRKPAKGRANPLESGEIANEKATADVQNIEARLKGILKNKRGLPLSIEGHVNYLIQEATSEKQLCQMYIGWASYL